jgi:hypothetical protein
MLETWGNKLDSLGCTLDSSVNRLRNKHKMVHQRVSIIAITRFQNRSPAIKALPTRTRRAMGWRRRRISWTRWPLDLWGAVVHAGEVGEKYAGLVGNTEVMLANKLDS